MIREYSINFNEGKITLKQYHNHIDDLSYHFREIKLGHPSGDYINRKVSIDGMISAFNRYSKEYEQECRVWGPHIPKK
jgi:hypothetical protein